jgi:hypothetical protein
MDCPLFFLVTGHHESKTITHLHIPGGEASTLLTHAAARAST